MTISTAIDSVKSKINSLKVARDETFDPAVDSLRGTVNGL